MAVKIKEYKVTQKGDRGLVITLPSVWSKDNDIRPGDVLEILRTGGNPDDLIIRKTEVRVA